MNARFPFARGAAFFALTMLAACASHGGAGLAGAPSSLGYASGSQFGQELGGSERMALARAFDAAMEGSAGEAKVWSSGEYEGAVTPGGRLVGGLKPDEGAMLPISAPIDLGGPLETELGLYALTSTANVRAGPSTKSRVLGQLGSGTGVDVVGKTPGKPWMLVAVDGELRGYIHESLMIKAPGADLTLAGGPTRSPVLCRPFEEHLTYYGRTDSWTGVSCKREGTWRVEPKTTTVANGAPSLVD